MRFEDILGGACVIVEGDIRTEFLHVFDLVAGAC